MTDDIPEAVQEELTSARGEVARLQEQLIACNEQMGERDEAVAVSEEEAGRTLDVYLRCSRIKNLSIGRLQTGDSKVDVLEKNLEEVTRRLFAGGGCVR